MRCGTAFVGVALYLRLDGMTVHHLMEMTREQKEELGRTVRHRGTRSIVDFADEKIISFDELEEDERCFCSMTANALLGCALCAVGAAVSLL